MFKFRLGVLSALLLGAFALVLGRLAQLQLVRHDIYVKARRRRLRRPLELLPARRGPIRDRHGVLLAADLPSFDLAIRADRLRLDGVRLEDVRRARRENPDPARRRAAFERLRGRLEREPCVRRLARKVERGEKELAEGLLKALDQVARGWVRPETPVPFLRGLKQAAWIALRGAQEDVFLAPKPVLIQTALQNETPRMFPSSAFFPGLECVLSVRRAYLQGHLLSHVLGTLGELSPAQLQLLKRNGVLVDHLAAREKLWSRWRKELDEARRKALRKILGDDLFALDVPGLLGRLRTLRPAQRRRVEALGLADALRWSVSPERMALRPAERMWMGGESGAGLRRGNRPLLADRRVGETGVESWYNEALRGKHGFELSFGLDRRDFSENPLARVDARPQKGRALALSIDAAWQRACEQALSGQPSPAAMVILDCRSGEVLAMASYPDFDPNLFSPPRSRAAELKALLQDPRRPLLNRCISDQFPPGSAIKPLLASAALEMGKVNPAEYSYCPGYLVEGRRRFHCDGHRAHGDVNLVQALRRSCNVYFYRLGARLGVEGLAPWARAVGFGRRTGLDLPGEVPGSYPDRAWRQRTYARPGQRWSRSWSRGRDYLLAIGQGDLAVTPLQLACLMATLANGGRALTPRLRLDAPAPPHPERRAPIFSPATLAVVRQALDEVVNVGTPGQRGTAYRAFHQGVEALAVRVAGKTGTADTGRGKAPHAWFAGYAPSQKPRIAFCVFVEHGGHGGAVAGPLAYRVLKAIYGTQAQAAANGG